MENKPHANPSGQRSSSFWFMNKIVNPLVCVILNSPLHKMMSSTLLLISYRGRRSGMEYCLPVQYVQTWHTIYIMPGMPEQKTWWRNLKEATPVKLTLRGQTLAGNALVLNAETDSAEILEGYDMFLRRFPAMAKVHQVRVEANGSFNPAALRLAAMQAVIMRVQIG